MSIQGTAAIVIGLLMPAENSKGDSFGSSSFQNSARRSRGNGRNNIVNYPS